MPDRLAAAAVRVVARDGFDVLSVRTVAREADVAPGTVQHHYPSRSRLLLAAFERTVVAVAARVGPIDPGEPTLPLLRRLLLEALPLDEQRHDECVVWIALTAAAVSHPELAEAHRRATLMLRGTLVAWLTEARRTGEVSTEVDPERSARLLAAVLDGLTLEGVAGTAPDQLVVVLDDMLERCLAPGP